VVAQAQKVDIEGQAIVFTFAPVHKALRAQLDAKRGWIEQLAQSVSGQTITVTTREGQMLPVVPKPEELAAASRQADLRARAKAEPTVQTMLDVFGGEIENVEEIE
jgi:hypothetical protein